MSLASAKGAVSSGLRRGLTPNDQAAALGDFLRSETIPSAAKRDRDLPTEKPPQADKTTPQQEIMNWQKGLQQGLREQALQEPAWTTEENQGEPKKDDLAYPDEGVGSVLDAATLQDPYAEESSVREKAQAATKRQELFSGTGPSPSSEDRKEPSSSSPASEKPSTFDRAKRSLGKELGNFQTGVQTAKKSMDEGEARRKKEGAAGQAMKAARKIKLVKERFAKLRDLTTAASGIGLVYYMFRMDVTIANRYFMKRKYLWGYREKEEYAEDSFLRWSDGIDLLEWFIFMSLRLLAVTGPLLVLFTWVILPIVVSTHAGEILGQSLGNYLRSLLQ